MVPTKIQRFSQMGRTNANTIDRENAVSTNSISDNSENVKYSLKENADLENRLKGDDLLNAYDTIETIKDVGGYVVEAVPDTRKHQLAVVSAYKKKAVQQTVDVQAPTHVVRNASADTASDTTISDVDMDVKYSVKEDSTDTEDKISQLYENTMQKGA